MTKQYQPHISILNYDDYIVELINTYQQSQQPITVNFRELIPYLNNLDRNTHFIHPYPAKLLQQIPYFFLNNSVFSKEGDTVLDPFCGTGTVLLEASLSGRNAVGVDVNPLASLIASTKVSKASIDDLKKMLNQIIDFFENIKPKQKYNVPLISNVTLWYSEKNIKKLAHIKAIISQIDCMEIRAFFQVVFSTACRKFSYSDPKVSVPVRIKKDKFPNGHVLKKAAVKHLKFIDENKVFEFFIDQALKNIDRLTQYQSQAKIFDSFVKVINNDIKKIDSQQLADSSIQLILTSPPYVSAQKYIRASSLSLQWLEINSEPLSDLDKKSIGREHFPKKECEIFHKTGFLEIDDLLEKIYQKNKLRAYITYKYLLEMQASFEIFYRVLKKNGFFIMVIGNNTIAGYEFMTYKFLIQIAEKLNFKTNLVLIDDIKSRGLMTKRNKTANLISREYIVIFSKGN